MNRRPRRGRRRGVTLTAAAAVMAVGCAATPADRLPERAAATNAATATRPASGTDAGDPAALPRPRVASPGSVSGIAPPGADDVPAVVVLEPSEAASYPPPAERPMMDQIATRFTPAAIVVRTGQPADFRNDDDKLHNVRVRERGRAADDLAFNIALPQGVTFDYTFSKDAAWDVRCDVHQNMYGLVVSTSSPFTAVAAEDGSFAIDGVPPGDYTAVAYTSRDRRKLPVHVAPGAHVTLQRW